MFVIWFLDPAVAEPLMRAEVQGLQAARCVWDALKKDGYEMRSERP